MLKNQVYELIGLNKRRISFNLFHLRKPPSLKVVMYKKLCITSTEIVV